jgi:hypothetical protein
MAAKNDSAAALILAGSAAKSLTVPALSGVADRQTDSVCQSCESPTGVVASAIRGQDHRTGGAALSAGGDRICAHLVGGCPTDDAARGDVDNDFIEGWYNLRRLHSSLGHRSPADYETTLAV